MSSSTAPNAVNPNQYLFGTPSQTVKGFGGSSFQMGGTQGIFDKGLYDQFTNMAKNGLDPKVKAMLEGQAGGQIAGGNQSINESFAGSGLSQGAKLGAQTALRSNVGKNLNNSLLEGDMNARQQGAGNIFSTLGLGMQGANSQNDYNLNKYNIDKQNEFSFGDAIGGLLGVGGQLGSSYIGKPKK